MKKSLIIAVLSLALFSNAPEVVSANAAMDTYIAEINVLLSLVTDLQKQLADLIAAKNKPSTPSGTAFTPILVTMPNKTDSYVEGYPLDVAWQGGQGKVQIGIIDENFGANGSVIGWISLSEKPNSSVVWDGSTIFDITGTVRQKLSLRSAGPYRIIAVSENASQALCISISGCNFDGSDEEFTLKMQVPVSEGSLRTFCSPSVASAQTNSVVTWQAGVENSTAPHAFFWGGSDGIEKLPPRGLNNDFLDVVYYTPGTKSAMVTVVDGNGKVHTAACSSFLKVSSAVQPLNVLTPNGGESFTMTKSTDPSQFAKVTWDLARLPTVSNRQISIGLLDIYGRVCPLGSVPIDEREAYVPLIEGYACRSTWQLAPGQYKFRVAVEGYESTLTDTSDTFITLTPPTLDAQTVIPSAASVRSGDSVSFKFVAPPNTVRATLNLFCPDGVTAGSANTCNRTHNVMTYVASSTEYSVSLKNSAASAKTVTANFYVYLPNNPSYARGVKTEVSVASGIVVGSQPITVTLPNGDETVWLGGAYTYTFSPLTIGTVDLSLVPDPAVDASKVCQIATGVSASLGKYTHTIPGTGACAKGPAKTIGGAYKLFVTHRNGETILSSDFSDKAFTVAASTTRPK